MSYKQYTMKNLTVLTLAILAVVCMLYAGFDGIARQYSYGPFLVFVGVCTAVGVAIDFFNHVQLRLRKNKISRLTGRF